MIIQEVENLINTVKKPKSKLRSNIKKYLLPGTALTAAGIGLADWVAFNNPVSDKLKHKGYELAHNAFLKK